MYVVQAAEQKLIKSANTNRKLLSSGLRGGGEGGGGGVEQLQQKQACRARQSKNNSIILLSQRQTEKEMCVCVCVAAKKTSFLIATSFSFCLSPSFCPFEQHIAQSTNETMSSQNSHFSFFLRFRHGNSWKRKSCETAVVIEERYENHHIHTFVKEKKTQPASFLLSFH